MVTPIAFGQLLFAREVNLLQALRYSWPLLWRLRDKIASALDETAFAAATSTRGPSPLGAVNATYDSGRSHLRFDICAIDAPSSNVGLKHAHHGCHMVQKHKDSGSAVPQCRDRCFNNEIDEHTDGAEVA